MLRQITLECGYNAAGVPEPTDMGSSVEEALKNFKPRMKLWVLSEGNVMSAEVTEEAQRWLNLVKKTL